LFSENERGEEDEHFDVKKFQKKKNLAPARRRYGRPPRRRSSGHRPSFFSGDWFFRERRELLSLPLCFGVLERGNNGEMN